MVTMYSDHSLTRMSDRLTTYTLKWHARARYIEGSRYSAADMHDLAEFSCKGSATVIGALLETVLTGDDRSFSVTLINMG